MCMLGWHPTTAMSDDITRHVMQGSTVRPHNTSYCFWLIAVNEAVGVVSLCANVV